MTKPYRERIHGGTSYESELGEYIVDVWGSEPFTNDDCWEGKDFKTKEEALAAFDDPGGYGFELDEVAFVVIDGPDIHKERRIGPDCVYDANDDDWKREQAVQAGMAFGCEGYNDVYGY